MKAFSARMTHPSLNVKYGVPSVRKSTVLPNKRQTHERVPETIFHKSTRYVQKEDGRILLESSTYRHGRPAGPTPKQRAKITKAMMEARRGK